MSIAPAPRPLTIHLASASPADQYGRSQGYLSIRSVVSNDEAKTQPVEYEQDLGGGLRIRCMLWGNHLFVGPVERWPWWGHFKGEATDEPLATISLNGPVGTRLVTREYCWYEHSGWGGSKTRAVTQDDCYLPGASDRQFHPEHPQRRPYIYVPVKVEAFGAVAEGDLRFPVPTVGTVTIDQEHLQNHGKPILRIVVNALGFEHTIVESFEAPKDHYSKGGPLEVLFRHLRFSTIEGGKDALWKAFLDRWHHDASTPLDAIKSIYSRKQIQPNMDRLRKEAPTDWLFFRWLHHKQTFKGRSNNQLLAAFLKEVGADYSDLLAALRKAREECVALDPTWDTYGHNSRLTHGLPVRREICRGLPGAADKIEAQEAAKDFRLRKTAEGQAEGLGVDAATYPKLHKAICDGNIPIGVFNQPTQHGVDGQPVNREFPLWERALSQKGWAEVIFEVCQNASRRTTYERDITPWLNALFTWPAYLNKHTPGRKKWTGFPKFVQSQWELEMDNDDDEKDGPQKTRKERSAFTPQVDNDNRVLTIPYVAVSISGVRTQWCYAKNYFIFDEGFTDPETGGIVLNDFEHNLNGQGDDYGLCYFTLTGTSTARGYPTFLIILERREGGDTWVHFHRVRPCRSANGVKTPACNLVEACYQYMAGNVPASDVTAQQGDLLFIKHNNDPIAAKAKVRPNPESGPAFEFESHRFESDTPHRGLTLHLSAAKQPKNRLGFMHAPGGLSVRHPEHDDIVGLEAGWYEVRRCKSYENNPVGIWSLTID